MNRTRIRRLLVGSIVGAGVAGSFFTVVCLGEFTGGSSGDLIATPMSQPSLATLLTGMLALLGLEMSRLAGRLPGAPERRATAISRGVELLLGPR